MVIEIKWLGHAWFQVKASGKNMHFDPAPNKHYDPDLSEKADLIFISHGHMDHWHRETIKALTGPTTMVLAPKKVAGKLGPETNMVAEGDRLDFVNGEIRVVPAYNLRKLFHRRGKGVGYLVTVEGKTIYHAGDTDFIPEMSTFGKVDVALLPMGGTYTMDVGEAAQAARTMRPGMVVPMHNLRTEPEELAKLLANEPQVKVAAMKPGEVLRLD